MTSDSEEGDTNWPLIKFFMVGMVVLSVDSHGAEERFRRVLRNILMVSLDFIMEHFSIAFLCSANANISVDCRLADVCPKWNFR